MLGVLDGELDVSAAGPAQALDGVLDREEPDESLGEGLEVGLAELEDEGVLVLEVGVDGGRRILDSFRDLAHRDGLEAFGREELPRRIEDAGAELLLLPLSSF